LENEIPNMGDLLPIAEQLNILFDVVTHPEGRPYTLNEVSEKIDVSLPTLSQLRTGKIKNPQFHTLRELCRFFNVPLRYFETATREECYAILAGDTDKPVAPLSEIALRSTSLSTDAQRDVLNLIKWVQAAEQLRREGKDLPPLPGLDTSDKPSEG
jgi:transcriptional regulator with XRE-family HTH domain